MDAASPSAACRRPIVYVFCASHLPADTQSTRWHLLALMLQSLRQQTLPVTRLCLSVSVDADADADAFDETADDTALYALRCIAAVTGFGRGVPGDDASSLRVPLLLLYHGRTHMFQFEHLRALRNAMPVDACSHICIVDDDDLYAPQWLQAHVDNLSVALCDERIVQHRQSCTAHAAAADADDDLDAPFRRLCNGGTWCPDPWRRFYSGVWAWKPPGESLPLETSAAAAALTTTLQLASFADAADAVRSRPDALLLPANVGVDASDGALTEPPFHWTHWPDTSGCCVSAALFDEYTRYWQALYGADASIGTEDCGFRAFAAALAACSDYAIVAWPRETLQQQRPTEEGEETDAPAPLLPLTYPMPLAFYRSWNDVRAWRRKRARPLVRTAKYASVVSRVPVLE